MNYDSNSGEVQLSILLERAPPAGLNSQLTGGWEEWEGRGEGEGPLQSAPSAGAIEQSI